MYIQGQIIKAEIHDTPLILHFGIITTNDDGDVFVLHNSLVGGTTTDTIENFTSDRTIIGVFDSPLMDFSNAELQSRFDSCQGDWDIDDYNCEHFIDCMLDQEQHSEQLEKIVIYTALSLIIILLITKPL